MRKEPITAEMLQYLAAKLKGKCDVGSLMILVLCLLGFAGFFRFSELCSIRCCDVHFFPLYMSIFLESSKTDQLHEGSWIWVARTKRDACPVAVIEKYISAAEIQLDDDLPLFQGSSPRDQLLKSSRDRERSLPRYHRHIEDQLAQFTSWLRYNCIQCWNSRSTV
jgi:hypothetical protein